MLRHGSRSASARASANASITSRWRSSSANWSAPPTPAGRANQQGHDPQIAKAVLPPEPIPKSGIGAGLLAHVIVSKFVDHLPLHRQESILARHGWDVRRSTLCDHLQKCGELLTPLYDLMHRRLLQSFAIHADDTPLLLLRPRRTAYAWVYLGDAAEPVHALRPHRRPAARPSRRRSSPATAASSTPTPTTATTRCTTTFGISGCWMHARRYFVEAEPSDPRAVEALAFIRTLYAVEREIKDEREKLGEHVHRRRRGAAETNAGRADPRPVRRLARSAAPLRDAEEPVRSGRRVLPESVGFARSLPRRRAVRHRQRGRPSGPSVRSPSAAANWLHVGGDGGLKTASVLLSVCASATRHRLNPWSYLRDVLDQLAARSAAADVGDLLPDAWAIRHARLRLTTGVSAGERCLPPLTSSPAAAGRSAAASPPSSPTPRSVS